MSSSPPSLHLAEPDQTDENAYSSEKLYGPNGNPVHVCVEYYGILNQALLSAQLQRFGKKSVDQLGASEYRKAYESGIGTIDQPFILDHQCDLASLDQQLAVNGVSKELRMPIIATVTGEGNRPKFETVGKKREGRFVVVVSYASNTRHQCQYLMAAFDRVRE
jgi:hypothetical protein